MGAFRLAGMWTKWTNLFARQAHPQACRTANWSLPGMLPLAVKDVAPGQVSDTSLLS